MANEEIAAIVQRAVNGVMISELAAKIVCLNGNLRRELFDTLRGLFCLHCLSDHCDGVTCQRDE